MYAKLLLAAVVLASSTFVADAKTRESPVAQTDGRTEAVSTCAQWRDICVGRGGSGTCTQKYEVCLKSGCFAETPKYGGTNHCNLTKK